MWVALLSAILPLINDIQALVSHNESVAKRISELAQTTTDAASAVAQVDPHLLNAQKASAIAQVSTVLGQAASEIADSSKSLASGI